MGTFFETGPLHSFILYDSLEADHWLQVQYSHPQKDAEGLNGLEDLPARLFVWRFYSDEPDPDPYQNVQPFALSPQEDEEYLAAVRADRESGESENVPAFLEHITAKYYPLSGGSRG